MPKPLGGYALNQALGRHRVKCLVLGSAIDRYC